MSQSIPITIVNECTVTLPFALPELLTALQTQVDRDYLPIWGGGPYTLGMAEAIPAGQWGLVLLDDADQADALGYHELTADGFPIGIVFVRTTLRDGENPTVTASHELLEMLADPSIDQTATDLKGRVWALEICDWVEETTYPQGSIMLSNFQTPMAFRLPAVRTVGTRAAGLYDFLGHCNKPFEILTGGYASIMIDGQWMQIFRSVRGADHFDAGTKWRPQAREDKVMRRSTR